MASFITGNFSSLWSWADVVAFGVSVTQVYRPVCRIAPVATDARIAAGDGTYKTNLHHNPANCRRVKKSQTDAFVKQGLN
jgi:hypothetical protein